MRVFYVSDCVFNKFFYVCVCFHFQLNSRDEPEKTFKVAMPDNAYSTVYLRDAMSVEEFLASACARRNLNPMEHFVRVKKRRDMEDHNYFVPHRNDLIENYVSNRNNKHKTKQSTQIYNLTNHRNNQPNERTNNQTVNNQ